MPSRVGGRVDDGVGTGDEEKSNAWRRALVLWERAGDVRGRIAPAKGWLLS